MSKVIGIDLGTGNSCVAVIEAGKPQVIANSEGSRTTPSVIFFDGGERQVGATAKRKMTTKPQNTVSFVKRFMGSEYTDPDVQKMLSQISYKVVDDGGKPRIEIECDGEKKLYSPEEISSYTLATLKKVAEDYYSEEVTDAVITCPAWFNDSQRQATKLAGELAGLNVLRIINEPTAAILSSNINAKDGDKVVAVVDCGCGTTDVSVCELSDVDGDLMVEVKASYGDVFLGGQNFDNAIVEWICDEFKASNDMDLRKDPMAYSRVIEAAEKAKCELSSASSTSINLPYITVVDGVPAHIDMPLSRAKFNQLTEDLVERIVDCTAKAFEKAGKTAGEIDEILLVGGLTRALNVQEGLTKAFGLPLDKSANPDEAVALGAAIQANIIAGGGTDSNILLLDVTPISLGIETAGEVMTKLIESNTTIPTSKTEVFTTAVDNQPEVYIRVLQGERQFSKDNKVIGQFVLDGIMPARRGVPQIEVTFDIDANGILSVTAKDKATGKSQHIKIENQNSLTKEEIEQIKADAEKYAAEDAKRKADVDRLNAAEQYAYAVQSSMKDDAVKDKIGGDADAINGKVEALFEAVKAKDVAKAVDAQKALEDVFNPVMERVYAEQQQQQPQPEPQQQPADDGGPVDVDFEEVE